MDSANEADVSQGSMSLLDISTTDDEDTHKCKAHEASHARMTLTLLHGGTSSSTMGLWVFRNGTRQYMTMLTLARRSQRTLIYDRASHFLHEGTRGVSAPSIHDKSSGVVSFLSHRSHEFVNTYTPKSTRHCGPSQQSPGSHKVPAPSHTSLLCSKVAPSHHWGYYRNCIHATCLHIFQSSCQKK